MTIAGFVAGGPAATRRGSVNAASTCRRRDLVKVNVEGNTVAAVATAMAGTLGGVGMLVWTEQQGKRNESRVNTQVCVECLGAKVVMCKMCDGTGHDPVSENEPCVFCDGKGVIECSNCDGTGIQPRFLERLSPEDFMD